MTHARSWIPMLVAVLLGLAWTTHAEADGVVNIDRCQRLSIPNTVYKLTKDLASTSRDCLIVAADRITIDLQGHSITNSGGTLTSGITDQTIDPTSDLVVVKNGTISGYSTGIFLASTRVSVIAVTAKNNTIGILLQGAQSLIKSCDASSNVGAGIVAFGDRAQIQQNTATKNGNSGIVAGDNCLVTMNTTNRNARGIAVGQKCTVSYNTANDNGG